MRKWISLPESLLVQGRGEPDLVEGENLPEVRTFMTAEGSAWREFDISTAAGSAAVIDGLKSILPFPWWCGSGWDSLDDAFQELRDAWPTPLCVAVHGLRQLLQDRPHLGLQVVIRLSDISEHFSMTGGQLHFLYVADHWR